MRHGYGGHSLDCRPNLFMTALTMKAHDLPRRPEWGNRRQTGYLATAAQCATSAWATAVAGDAAPGQQS
jgi:hypothetical protein